RKDPRPARGRGVSRSNQLRHHGDLAIALRKTRGAHAIVGGAESAQTGAERSPLAVMLENPVAEPHTKCARARAGFEVGLDREPLDADPALVDFKEDRQLVGEASIKGAGR